MMLVDRVGWDSDPDNLKCAYCNEPFEGSGETRVCGNCRGEISRRSHVVLGNYDFLRGPRSNETPAGYRLVAGPDGFSSLEHRLVAEAKLGRPLCRSEVVHHRDGDKHNNFPENLEVMSPEEHTAIHILKPYLASTCRARRYSWNWRGKGIGGTNEVS